MATLQQNGHLCFEFGRALVQHASRDAADLILEVPSKALGGSSLERGHKRDGGGHQHGAAKDARLPFGARLLTTPFVAFWRSSPIGQTSLGVHRHAMPLHAGYREVLQGDRQGNDPRLQGIAARAASSDPRQTSRSIGGGDCRRGSANRGHRCDAHRSPS